MEQVMNFSSALPIKKRRFIVTEPAPPPVDEPASPPAEEIPLISMDIKQESNICGDVTETSDLNKSSAIEAAADVTVENSESILLKPETVISDRSVDELNNEVNISPVEEPAEEVVLNNTRCAVPAEQDDVLTNSTCVASVEKDCIFTNNTCVTPVEQAPMEQDDVLTNSIGADTLIVKQELVNRQSEVSKELSVGSKKSELPLEKSKESILPAAMDNPDLVAAISGKPNESSSSLLILDVSSVKHDNNEIPMENSRSPTYSNRSNWDLNTNMDEWEGSATNGSSNNSNTHGLESPLSNLDEKTGDGKVSLCLDKGKHTLDEYSSSSSSRSLLPSQCKPGDSLGLSLGMPFRARGISGSHFFLSQKFDSANDCPKFNLQKIQSSKILSLASGKPVKLEPVAEDLESASRVGFGSTSVGSSMFQLKSEILEKESSALTLMPSLSPKEADDRISVKPEPIQERDIDVNMFENSVRLRQFGRVMQHQESTASSSGLSMPLTPQNSCPSRLSTESIISKDQSQNSFPCGELLPRKETSNNQIVAMVSKSLNEDGRQPILFDTGNMNVDKPEKFEHMHVDAHGNSTIIANDEEKLNLSTEMLEEEAFGSDCESPMVGERPSNKEEGEYEEGEVRTPLQQSAGAYPIEEKKTVNSEFVEYRDLKPLVPSSDRSTITSNYSVKSAVSETYVEHHNDHIKECMIMGSDTVAGKNPFQKLSDNVLEAGADEKRSMNNMIDKRSNLSIRQDVKKELGEGVYADGQANASYGTVTGLVDKSTVIFNKFYSGKHESTFSTQDTSLSGSDGAKDSSSAGNKSRIITLPRASGVPSPSCTTRSIPNRLLTPRSGKGRYSDLEEDIQPRAIRNELYASSPKIFAKDRVHDLSLRNSRPSFMRGRGRGRGGGRFSTVCNEWGSDNDFASESYSGQSDYRARRHKQHSSSVDDGEFVYSNGYSTGPDGSPMFSGRRKAMNDGKFIRNLSSDELNDPVYSRPQTSYDEFDGQLTRGTRNFSTIQRKVYPRVQSKSPVRARTRSPGPWSSRRRRSPEINQHRSPPVYRMRKMRSPDRAYEMVSRRRESPHYVTRHSGDLRDGGSVPDHNHPRPVNPNRRSPQAREFIRPARREMLDSRERGDESVDERRKFIERRGPFPPFRQSYNEGNENFHFQVNDDPRSFRFCPDGDTQFVERNNMREREFHGHIKHQPSLESRRPREAEGRPRDIDDQDGTSYRPGGRVWHDDDFSDISGLKRRRF